MLAEEVEQRSSIYNKRPIRSASAGDDPRQQSLIAVLGGFDHRASWAERPTITGEQAKHARIGGSEARPAFKVAAS